MQKAPGLFAAIKLDVDNDPRPGRLLLTGSANVFLLPSVSESLAGRVEIVPMQPLAQNELAGRMVSFVDRLFSARPPTSSSSNPIDRADMSRRIIAGGFPEAIARQPGQRRGAWFGSYIASLLQRDVRDIANIDGLVEMPKLLSLLAARASSLVNTAELGRATGIAQTTLRRYLTLLEAIYLYQPLPAWSNNLGKRFVKAPKVHLVDSGLTAHLRGDSDPARLANSSAMGPLLESFVVQEVRKQMSWSANIASAYHFRTAAGREVDLVIERAGGDVVGIEIKASSTVSRGDFAGIDALAEAAGAKFVAGAVVYLGAQPLPFGANRWALPIDALWREIES